MRPQVAFSLVLGAVALGAIVWASETVVRRTPIKNRTTVVYWEKWTSGEGEAMRKIVDWYNRSQDKIFVRYLSISNVDRKTLLAASGGNPPDVAGIWDNQVALFADAGALQDLSELAARNGIKREDYIPVYWSMGTYGDKLFALPSTPASSAMHVNRSLMPERFKDPKNFPKTLEELDELVDEISIKGSDGRMKLAGYLPAEPGWWNYGWGMVFGGRLFDGDQLTVNSKENIRAFKWVESYAKKFGAREVQSFQSGFGNFSSPQNAFLSGKVAMCMQGVWMANYIRMYNPKLDWFAVPFPTPADRPDLRGQSFAGMDILVIPTGAKQPEAAFDFIKFVQRQDVMEELCKSHGKNSPLAQVSDEFFKTHQNPYIRLFDELARGKNICYVPQTGIWAELAGEINDAFQRINLGERSPDDALASVQDRMAKALIRYRDQMQSKKVASR